MRAPEWASETPRPSNYLIGQLGDFARAVVSRFIAQETPGGSLRAVHRVSRNASAAEAVTLLAIYVAPSAATSGDLMKPL